MSDQMIEVRNFRKTYGEHTAVDDISFTVYQGEIFGLLGPNGVGKTSTLEALEGPGLQEKQHVEFQKLSTGQQRRCVERSLFFHPFCSCDR